MQDKEQTSKNVIIAGGVLTLVALALPLVGIPYQEYAMSVLTFAFIYTLLGQSWNLLGGLAKQFSLGPRGLLRPGRFCHRGL